MLFNLRDAGAMTNEAFTRVSIDKELEFSRWNLLNTEEVLFKLSGSNGRADYILSGQRGPLGMLVNDG